MLKLTTPVEVGRSRVPVSYSDSCLILGSCFAENIGRLMAAYGFRVLINPLGTAYNPVSVRQTLRRIIDGSPFTADECVPIGAGDGRYCTFWHHTRHAHADRDIFLAHANASLAEAHAFWRGATRVIVTFGTAWCFRRKADNMVVTNCLKRDAKEFERYLMDVGESTLHAEAIAEMAAGRGLIFTVSPIRHWADGAHGNTLSKAVLHLSASAAVAAHAGTADYFPSYEIMTDELRDYRFYADDMNHPSPLAERHIFDRFMDFALPEEERDVLARKMKEAKRMGHETR